jgi:hypothetical protein
MDHLLIDENHFPTPSLIFLFDLMGITHDYSLKSMVRATQQKWLQPCKECWHFDPKEEHRMGYIFPFLQKIGCVDAVYPKEQQYDYALVLGGYYTFIQSRLKTLVNEWEKGVRFRRLVFLTGERFLDPRTEAPLFNFTSKQTEAELMLHLWEKHFASSTLKGLPFTLVDTPGSKNKEGNWLRPTTMDTILKWLSYAPKPGKCLCISSQPFIGYQHSVLSTYLPKNFLIETIGDGAEKDLPLSVYLDNLARWLYQEAQK